MSITIASKKPIVELNKLSDATVRNSMEPSSSSATVSSMDPNIIRKPLKKTAVPEIIKQPAIDNDKRTISDDVHSKSIVTFESSAADKSLYKKNFMKHLELNTISPQGTFEGHSENCNGLLSAETTGSVISAGQESVNSSSSIEDGEKSSGDTGDFERTELENSDKPVDRASTDFVTGVDSINVSSNPADGGSSLSPTPQEDHTTEHVGAGPVEVSESQNNGAMASETVSVSSEDVVMSEDNSVCQTSSMGEKEVPSVPIPNSEESVSGSRDDISDTVSDVLNRLEFYEETPAVEQATVYKQEDIFPGETVDLCDHDSNIEMIPAQPSSSSNILTNVPQCNNPQCNAVHNNPAANVSESGPSGENMVPIFIQQPNHYVQVAASGNSQDQTVCCIPLPEDLRLEKYQNKVYSVIRATVEEIWHDYVNAPNIRNSILSLQKEIEELKAKYNRDMKDVSDNSVLLVKDVKSQMEKEKTEAVEAVKKKCEEEKEKAINETKKKAWCKYCGKEARYYCCWNTCYCDHSCQEAHWTEHIKTCKQPNPYDDYQNSPSPSAADADAQRNQGEGSRPKKFCKETYSKQQRSRGGHSSMMSSKGQIPPPYQSPPHPSPFTSPQPPMMTSNYVSNVIPSTMTVIPGQQHIGSVGPSSPFVNRLPPPPPPPAPNHQSLPFASGQHPHQNQNAPHYQTANSQGNRMLSPVLPPHTSYQSRQYYSSPSTSKLYMGGPRDVRYPAKPYM